MMLPSVDAKNRYSTRAEMVPVQEKTPSTFRASSLTARRKASFSWIATSDGSLARGVRVCDCHGLLRGARDRVARAQVAGREAPGALRQDTDAEAVGLRVRDG